VADPSPLWFQIIQACSYICAAGSAAVAAAKYQLDRKAVDTARAESNTRKLEENAARQSANAIAERELEWRKMAAAQSFLEHMEKDHLAATAMKMLDWTERSYEIDGLNFQLTEPQMHIALRVENGIFTAPEMCVRDAFDHLFWYLERLNYQIDIGMLDLTHVEFPLVYLVSQMNRNMPVFRAYLDGYGYERTRKLVEDILALMSSDENNPLSGSKLSVASPAGGPHLL
jgi:hypothetical protein